MKLAYFAFAPLLAAMAACGGRTELQDGSWDIAPSAGHANAGVSGSSSGGASGGSSGGQGAAAGVSGAVGTAGTPGTDPVWRQSLEPFCGGPDQFGPATLDLWSDRGGVFLLVDNEIYSNFGHGWSLLDQTSNAGRGGLSGFPAGPLVRYGAVTQRCGIEFVQRSGTYSCSGAASPWSVSVVNDQLAYGVYSNRLLRYDGKQWTQSGDPLKAPPGLSFSQVWANDSAVVITNDFGVYVGANGAAPTLQTDLPQVEGGYAGVWGIAGSRWVGSVDGRLFRSDGSGWMGAFKVPGAAECRGIRRIWGDEVALFFATDNGVWRGRAGQFERILELPCDGSERVGALWGNSASEVFIAIAHSDSRPECGNTSLLWFDGQQTHAL
jgi:hypothetical protein